MHLSIYLCTELLINSRTAKYICAFAIISCLLLSNHKPFRHLFTFLKISSPYSFCSSHLPTLPSKSSSILILIPPLWPQLQLILSVPPIQSANQLFHSSHALLYVFIRLDNRRNKCAPQSFLPNFFPSNEQ